MVQNVQKGTNRRRSIQNPGLCGLSERGAFRRKVGTHKACTPILVAYNERMPRSGRSNYRIDRFTRLFGQSRA